jgi:MraZ protein
LAEFWGRYEYSLDDRGRVSIPAQFREDFQGIAYLTISPDGCVEVYTPAAFRRMADTVSAHPRTTPEGRQMRRETFGRTHRSELDRQGRILIPASLRDQAAVDGQVVIMGTLDCLEIWNPERLQAQEAGTLRSGGQEHG